MSNSEELEEILYFAHQENIFDDVISEVNKLKIKDKITIEGRLEIYKKAIKNVRRDKAV